MEILNIYQNISGQRINRNKSDVFFGKHITVRRSDDLIHNLKMRRGALHFLYLGIPLFKEAPEQKHLRSIVDGILAKFS